MPSRWAISPIVGTGAPGPTTCYRPKVADLGVSFSGEMPPRAANATPARAWMLVRVEAPSLTAVTADATVDVLPDLALDDPLRAALSNNQLNVLKARLNRWGIDASSLTTASTFAALLFLVGSLARPGFSRAALWPER